MSHFLFFNAFDIGGGPERVAADLISGLRRRGHGAKLCVQTKIGDDPDVLSLPTMDARWNTWLRSKLHDLSVQHPNRGFHLLNRTLNFVTHPKTYVDEFFGVENFNFPGSKEILNSVPEKPDILHIHAVTNCFDLRTLPYLSKQVPVALTLHDAWLLAGHCVHSFDCERWKTGCGECPDLTIFPEVRRDATAYNWRRKRDIYKNSRLYIATPSKWLLNRVEESILSPGIKDARVIHNGIDQNTFCPANKNETRQKLNIPMDANVMLFTVANGVTEVFKDYKTIRKAVDILGHKNNPDNLLLIALGDNSETEQVGNAEIRFIPHQKDISVVANYYQAADIYVHGARVDTFPNAVLEALSCGTPVVATGVAGIPEQIKNLNLGSINNKWQQYDNEQATGILVNPGNPEDMAFAAAKLLSDKSLRLKLGENANRTAQKEFSLERQVEEYLLWYDEIITNWQK